jgi:hypothetical protein
MMNETMEKDELIGEITTFKGLPLLSWPRTPILFRENEARNINQSTTSLRL